MNIPKFLTKLERTYEIKDQYLGKKTQNLSLLNSLKP
jgi:hypothetical protein